jgi:DNA-binding CsgD family transcriptional regulator
MESLLPALSQLTVRDTDDVLPLATAVTGYAYALQGNSERAARYLVQSREFQQRPSWQAQQLAQYFHAAAAAILAGMKPGDGPLPSGAEPSAPVPAGNGGFTVPTPEEAADRLCLLAEQAKERSAVAVAMACLAPAARLGNAAAATQLEEIARSLPGSSAAMYADLAAGLLRDDAEALLRTVRTAQFLDNTLLAHQAARQAHAVAAKVGDRSLMRTARTMENDSFRRLRHAHSIDQRLNQLSKFELELAQLAASGESSAGMGQMLSLSPRTVDWHLGRIFEKLHVSGRAELRQVLE